MLVNLAVKKYLKFLLITYISLQANLAIAQNIFYQGRVELGGYYQNHANSFALLDILLPLAQTADQLLFVDLRGLDRQHPSHEGNIGLAYRQLNNANTQLWGVYSFYDRKRSAMGNDFNQVSFGSEYKSTTWLGDFNIYLPFGHTSVVDHAFDMPQLVNSNNQYGFQNIIYRNGAEKALHGFDAEIGYKVSALPALTTYLGAYYFTATDTPTVSGPHIHLLYQLPGLLSLTSRVIDHVNLESIMQYDSLRGFQWAGGLRFSSAFGGNTTQHLSQMQQHMLDYIQRDLDVVTLGNTRKPAKLLTNLDGTPVTVGITTDNLSLDNAIQHNANVIVVRGNIALTHTVQLQNGQYLTGGSFTFAQNSQIRLSDYGSLNAQDRAIDALQVQKNNTIRDLHITVDPTYYAITNLTQQATGNSVGQLLIDHVIANGPLHFDIADGSQDSEIIFAHNQLNLGNINSGEFDAIYLRADNQASVTAAINHNAIFYGNIATNASAIGIETYAGSGATLNFTGGLNHNYIRYGNSADGGEIVFTDAINNIANNGTLKFDGGIKSNIIQLGDIGDRISYGISNAVENNGLLTISGGFLDNKVSFGLLNNALFARPFINQVYDSGAITILGFHGNSATTLGGIGNYEAYEFYTDTVDSYINVNVKNDGLNFAESNGDNPIFDGNIDNITITD